MVSFILLAIGTSLTSVREGNTMTRPAKLVNEALSSVSTVSSSRPHIMTVLPVAVSGTSRRHRSIRTTASSLNMSGFSSGSSSITKDALQEPLSIDDVDVSRCLRHQGQLVVWLTSLRLDSWNWHVTTAENASLSCTLNLTAPEDSKLHVALWRRASLSSCSEQNYVTVRGDDGYSFNTTDCGRNFSLYNSLKNTLEIVVVVSEPRSLFGLTIIVQALEAPFETKFITANLDSTITVRPPDTDVFILLLKYAENIPQTIHFETGVSNKRRHIDIKNVALTVGKEICSVLPAVHAFSGCDTTSAFVRKGKIAPIKTLKQHPEYNRTFAQLGVMAQIHPTVTKELEEFTCVVYRGRGSCTKDIDKFRYEKFLERFNTSEELLTCYDRLLPPCRDSLLIHIERVNYQTLIWNHSHEPKPHIPSPEGHGWQKTSEGLEVTWTRSLIMPAELVEVLVENPPAPEVDDAPDSFSFTDFVFIDNE